MQLSQPSLKHGELKLYQKAGPVIFADEAFTLTPSAWPLLHTVPPRSEQRVKDLGRLLRADLAGGADADALQQPLRRRHRLPGRRSSHAGLIRGAQ